MHYIAIYGVALSRDDLDKSTENFPFISGVSQDAFINNHPAMVWCNAHSGSRSSQATVLLQRHGIDRTAN